MWNNCCYNVKNVSVNLNDCCNNSLIYFNFDLI